MPSSKTAQVFVPGHVTGLFTVHRREDPARTGSRGAGLTLSDGAEVTVEREGSPGLSVNAESTTVESVEAVLAELEVEPAIAVETDLPLGAGFGLSGSMALGTALGANLVYGLGYTENELIRIAHVADVAAGTGLGDVVAAARGGAPIRLEPGAPPHGSLDGIPETARVEYLTFGGLSTPEVLKERPHRISEAGERGLEALLEQPTLRQFMAVSRTFATDVGLLTDEIEAVLETVRNHDGQASMAMLGRTVFALGTDLSDAGYAPQVARIHPAGAIIR
jgi:pantoate kinase